MKIVYTCNVNANGGEQEPLGLPSMNFEEPASTRRSSASATPGTGMEHPNANNPQNETEEPLGLPSLFEEE